MKEVVLILKQKVMRVEYYRYTYNESDMPRLTIELNLDSSESLRTEYYTSNDRIKVSFEIDNYNLTYDCVISSMSEVGYSFRSSLCNVEFIVFSQSIHAKPCQFCKNLHMYGDSLIGQKGQLVL